jgi:DNA-binding GntR family transcriptional regulator
MNAPRTLVRIETTPDLVDRVYRALLDAISSGALSPGQRITQEEIAEQLAVSRQPVLQALRWLKRDGLVSDAPGRGVQVAPLDAQSLVQVYQVRGALDALAARWAARSRSVIDPQLLNLGRQAAKAGDVGAMIEADIAFHEAIYQASGNPLIAQTAQTQWQHLRRAMGAVLQQSRQRDALWDEHAAIASAIAAGDEDLAVQCIEAHAHRASENLAAELQQVLAQRPAERQPLFTSPPLSIRSAS